MKSYHAQRPTQQRWQQERIAWLLMGKMYLGGSGYIQQCWYCFTVCSLYNFKMQWEPAHNYNKFYIILTVSRTG